MIFPWVSGILSFRLAPVTWCLFLLQFAVYLFSYFPSAQSEAVITDTLQDPVFSEVQGHLFASYVLDRPDGYGVDIQELAKTVLQKNDPEKSVLLGGMAFRDIAFVRDADTQDFQGDQVQVRWWRQKFDKLMQVRNNHPSFILGLGDDVFSGVKMITYQFAHSGAAHFFGNMIFMLIFGCALEVLMGGLAVLLVFLGSGIIAAAMFLLLDNPTAVPLIGASGAISGLMALFAVTYWDRGVRYVFFLLVPKRGYAGFVYLPGWFALVMWALADMAGYLSSPNALGGVAHSAHLGGELAGALVGVALYAARRWIFKSQFRSAFIDEKPIFTTVT